MPNIVNNTSGLTFYQKQSGGYEITSTEGTTNGTIIWNMVSQMGWTVEAASAMLGNISAESGVNPGRHEVGGSGYGLVQWTPQSALTDALDIIYPEGYSLTDGVQQVNAIIAEYMQTNHAQGNPDSTNWGVERQWYNSSGGNYGFSLPAWDWYEWAHLTGPLEEMTKSFMISYERPAYAEETNHWPQRVANAETWYTILSGLPPGGRKRRFPVFLMNRRMF